MLGSTPPWPVKPPSRKSFAASGRRPEAMPSFRYVAVDSAGQTQRGVMEAPDQATVIEKLQRQGQIPMRAELAGRRGFLDELFSIEFGGKRNLSRQDVADVTRELAIMLGAGQDLDRALRFLVETAASARVR